MKLFRSWKDKFQNSSFYHWLKVDDVYLKSYQNFPDLLQEEKRKGAGRWLGFWCYVACVVCFFASSFLQFFRMSFLEQDNPVYFVLNATILAAAVCFAAGSSIAFRRSLMLGYSICLLLWAFLLIMPFDLQIYLQMLLGNDMCNFVFGGAILGMLLAAGVIWWVYKNSPLAIKLPNAQD